MAVESMHYACAWIWQLMNYMYAAEMYYVHHASPFYIDVLFTGIKMESNVLGLLLLLMYGSCWMVVGGQTCLTCKSGIRCIWGHSVHWLKSSLSTFGMGI